MTLKETHDKSLGYNVTVGGSNDFYGMAVFHEAVRFLAKVSFDDGEAITITGPITFPDGVTFEDDVVVPDSTEPTHALNVGTAQELFASFVLHNLEAVTDPTPANNAAEGYGLTSLWLNVSTGEYFRYVGQVADDAIWKLTTLEPGDLGSAAFVEANQNLRTTDNVQFALTTVANATADTHAVNRTTGDERYGRKDALNVWTETNLFSRFGPQCQFQNTDNTATMQEHFRIRRGDGSGQQFRIRSLGNGSNGIAALSFGGGSTYDSFNFHNSGNVSFGSTADPGVRLGVTGNVNITGNLGVGVTPARKLHVSDDQVRIDRTQNDTSSRTHLQFVRGSGAGSTALINTVGGGANDVTRLRFNVAGGDRVDISSTGLEVTGAITATAGANLATSSGNVGIGTSTPGSKLEVRDTADIEVRIVKTGVGRLDIKVGDDGTVFDVIGSLSAQRKYSMLSGNLGIRKLNPAVALDVNGAGSFTTGITPATAVTVAGLPSAAASTGLIHRVTNEATYGNTLVTSDGTNWLNVLDGTTTTAA
jgi:hypothetical protein